MIRLAKNWAEVLEEELNKPYFKNLQVFLEDEYKTKTVYPSPENVFSALNAVKFNDVKVVIVGQDPYHEPGQAQGLAFSVPRDVAIPPSLVNIYKEIESDVGGKCAHHGELKKWARQGVLLLNSVLTVRAHQAFSHRGKGWEELTTAIVKLLSAREKPLVFILWGASAGKLAGLVDTSKHLVIRSAHPSPLSAYNGFFGSKPFSKANKFLKEHGEEEIDWVID